MKYTIIMLDDFTISHKCAILFLLGNLTDLKILRKYHDYGSGCDVIEVDCLTEQVRNLIVDMDSNDYFIIDDL